MAPPLSLVEREIMWFIDESQPSPKKAVQKKSFLAKLLLPFKR